MHRAADVGVLGEELAGEHEQVVELQPAGGAPLGDGIEREPPQQRPEREPSLLVELGELAAGELLELLLGRAAATPTRRRPHRGASS